VTTIGVLGGAWRAAVDADGTVSPLDGGPALRWHVAADDRWHTPATSSTLRQRVIDGTPVVETRMRIPRGDVVHRVYAVVAADGMTVIEVENDSPLPIAVAFEGAKVLSARAVTTVPLHGIELPADAQVFPIGHRASVTVALPHRGSSVDALPRVAASDAVVRGWLAVVERAGRLVLPDSGLVESVTAARCELLLGGAAPLIDDPAAFLIGVGELSRLGTDVTEWLPEIAAAVESLAPEPTAWEIDAALDAAARLLAATGERRASRDLARICVRRVPADLRPPSAPDGIRVVPWVERMLVRGTELLPEGLPDAWAGQPIEVHGLPTGPASSVSFALRWHGERPAILWESTGEPVELTAPVVAPDWVGVSPAGDALWPPHEAAAHV
jgi:hypothetical protein